MKDLILEQANLSAERFIAKIKDGSLSKDCLSNHGRPFTGGPEQLSRYKFNAYLSSCGYVLLNRRIKDEPYYGC